MAPPNRGVILFFTLDIICFIAYLYAVSKGSIKKSKIFQKILDLMLDKYHTFMIEYICKRERDTFLQKRVSKG